MTVRIRVTAESPYDVIVGSGALGEVADVLPREVSQVAVIHSALQGELAAAVVKQLREHFDPLSVVVPDGEAAKHPEVATSCWQQLARRLFTRSDAVVSVGGGATTDLAGFVAATFLRGVPVVHVPTTLLGMVDAAVGGKTGINLPQGKNLVGTIHEPTAVVCDSDVLRTLPAAEVRSGLAEVLKCGFIADPVILELIRNDPSAAVDVDSPVLRQLIERSIRVKADVVSRDLREVTDPLDRVGREALNYGHTLGHALERVERYAIRHGVAVAIGMVYVAELAALAGRLDPEVVQDHRNLLSAVGLPTSYSRRGWEDLRDAMRTDKKARGDRLRFVVLEAVARPTILEAPDEDLLVAAYRRIAESAAV